MTLSISDDSWRPDWKDPDQYPDLSSSDGRWAWEFLRRNSTYRHDWSCYMACDAGHALLEAETIRQKYLVMEPYAPSTVDFDSVRFDPIFRPQTDCIPIMPQAIADALKDQPDVRWGVAAERPNVECDLLTDFIAKFDLRYDLESQLRFVKSQLMSRYDRLKNANNALLQEKKTQRRTKTNYVPMLRALDGKVIGATNHELGEILCSKNQDQESSLKDLLKSANKMCRHGYKKLLGDLSDHS